MADFVGTSGDDDLDGTHGVDSFDLSQGGDDTAHGGQANDTFNMGGALTSDDRIVGGEGNDIMVLDGDYSGGVVLTSASVIEVERIALEAGHDYQLKVRGRAADFTVDFQSHIGADDHLVLDARGGDSLLYESSGFGHETILGSAGFDDLFLGAGLDAGDRIDGGAGGNGRVYLDGDYSAGVTMTNRTLQNVDQMTLRGGPYDLTFAKATVLSRGMSIDAGDLSHAQSLHIDASKSDYLGTLFIFAGGGNDELMGGHGADFFIGGKGIDRLTGGGGADQLGGGEGADRFVYNHVSDSTAEASDRIFDLAAGDVVNLKHIDADATTDGNQAFHMVGSLGGHAGELTLSYDSVSNLTSILGDVDGDGQADLTIYVQGDQTGFSGLAL